MTASRSLAIDTINYGVREIPNAGSWVACKITAPVVIPEDGSDSAGPIVTPAINYTLHGTLEISGSVTGSAPGSVAYEPWNPSVNAPQCDIQVLRFDTGEWLDEGVIEVENIQISKSGKKANQITGSIELSQYEGALNEGTYQFVPRLYVPINHTMQDGTAITDPSYRTYFGSSIAATGRVDSMFPRTSSRRYLVSGNPKTATLKIPATLYNVRVKGPGAQSTHQTEFKNAVTQAVSAALNEQKAKLPWTTGQYTISSIIVQTKSVSSQVNGKATKEYTASFRANILISLVPGEHPYVFGQPNGVPQLTLPTLIPSSIGYINIGGDAALANAGKYAPETKPVQLNYTMAPAK